MRGVTERDGIKAPVDELAGDVAEAKVVLASVSAQPSERLINADMSALGQHTLSLLDHHTAAERALELLHHTVRLAHCALL